MRRHGKVIETGLSEGKDRESASSEAMAHSLRCQVENFAPNMEFVSQSFDKAMDETINPGWNRNGGNRYASGYAVGA